MVSSSCQKTGFECQQAPWQLKTYHAPHEPLQTDVFVLRNGAAGASETSCGWTRFSLPIFSTPVSFKPSEGRLCETWALASPHPTHTSSRSQDAGQRGGGRKALLQASSKPCPNPSHAHLTLTTPVHSSSLALLRFPLSLRQGNLPKANSQNSQFVERQNHQKALFPVTFSF